MIYLKFIFCIFSILITGYVLLRLFFYSKERFCLGEVIVLSFGIGTGFAGLEVFLLSFTINLLNITNLLILQLILVFIAILKFRRDLFYLQKSYGQQKFTYSILEVLFLLIIFWEIVYVSLEAFSLPFTAWDAWGNWGFKAKMFFVEKTLPFRLWRDLPWIHIPDHLDYPILIPLIETYVYLFLGQIHEPLIKLFCSFYYTGIIALFYYHLRRQFINKFALGSCLCLATIPNLIEIASTGYPEAPFTFYITCGILYVWRYLIKRDIFFLLLGVLFMGLGMWVKNEGLALWSTLSLTCILICLLFKLNINKMKFLFKILFIPLLIYSPWLIFKNCLKTKVEFFESSLESIFNLASQRIPLILNIWIRNCFNIQKWNILWIGFAISLVWFFIKPRERLSIFFLFIIFFQIALDFIIYIIWPETMEYVRWQILNSVDRLPLQIAPLALFFICLQLGKKWTIVDI